MENGLGEFVIKFLKEKTETRKIIKCDEFNITCVYINTIPSSSLPYDFQIPTIMEGQVSFNLKVIDNNGCTSISNILI